MANGHYGMPRALLVVPKRFPFCLKYHTRGYDLNEGGLVYRYLASCYVTGALDATPKRRGGTSRYVAVFYCSSRRRRRRAYRVSAAPLRLLFPDFRLTVTPNCQQLFGRQIAQAANQNLPSRKYLAIAYCAAC